MLNIVANYDFYPKEFRFGDTLKGDAEGWEQEQKKWYADRIRPRCGAVRHWQDRQKFPSCFHIYQTHFYGAYEPYRITERTRPIFDDAPWFPRTPNLWERRHQAFKAHSDDSCLLLADNALIDPAFTLGEHDADIVSFQSHADFGELEFAWLLSPRALKYFASLSNVTFNNRYRNDLWLLRTAAAEGLKFEIVQQPEIREWNVGERFELLAGANGGDIESVIGETEYFAWNAEQFDAWRNSFAWRLANSMRWCPHDYIITLTHNFNVVEAYPAFDYMLRNCVIEFWLNRRPTICCYAGSDRYWVEALSYVNHTNPELTRSVFMEDGKDEFGRKI